MSTENKEVESIKTTAGRIKLSSNTTVQRKGRSVTITHKNPVLRLFGKTIVEVNPHAITITVEPNLFSNPRFFLAKDIKQISVQWGALFYHLVMTTTSEKLTLLGGIDKRENALFLEEEIKSSLGIIERNLFPGAIWGIWQAFAESYNLRFKSDKYLEAHRVFGKYRGYYFKLIPYYKNDNQLKTYMEMAVNSPSSLPLLQNTDVEQVVENQMNGVVEEASNSVTPFDARDFLKTLDLYADLLGEIGVKEEGKVIFYEQDDLVEERIYLERILQLLTNLLNTYQLIIDMEEKAIPFLRAIANKHQPVSSHNYKESKRRYTHPMKPLALSLLKAIASKTVALAHIPTPLLCKNCFCYCVADSNSVSSKLFTHYGCRACYQFRNFYEVKQVIAVLDEGMTVKVTYDNEVVRVNWLQHQALFDFDTVEIGQVSEEMIERFVVQVGNNPDFFWRTKPQDVICYLSNSYYPSNVTERMLTQVFAQVERI